MKLLVATSDRGWVVRPALSQKITGPHSAQRAGNRGVSSGPAYAWIMQPIATPSINMRVRRMSAFF